MEICRYLVCEMSVIPGMVSVVSLQVPLSNFRYEAGSTTLLAARLLSLFLICVLERKNQNAIKGAAPWFALILQVELVCSALTQALRI